ncbi:uncharacterized protein LOC110231364 [Exaiptasia diaphana]|uniref:Uncharacterized protein n=1 Tax=Exaiptasia diaphana TaxID=2652724 RepID=A0A913WPC1_EXADI|nr:uncharacterized protein LOC110231364 [Exaiptasia diaphana]KXJ19078.1 hypothetical protein AC249_AIPGENE14263 [Exaiptasia diaphana]
MKTLVILAALTLVAVWTVEGQRARDSIVLRVFNKDFKIPTAKMHAVLKKANLESHGYEKEVITKLVRHPVTKKAEYTKMYFYYKTVTCDKVLEVEQELDKLLGGKILGASVYRKAQRDLKKIGDPTKTCKSGIEIHYRNQQHCGKMADDEHLDKRSAAPCGICIGSCWRAVKY